MPEPVLGELIMVSFNFAPKGYALCNGQLLNIAEHRSLYDLFGTTYGGDGVTQFALPDLRGRVPISVSPTIAQGIAGGEEGHVLTNTEFPTHSHPMYASSDAANESAPTGNLIAAVAAGGENLFAAESTIVDSNMASTALGVSGEAQAHNNMQPSFVINYCIAIEGNPPPTPTSSLPNSGA